jgi:opacity protein-like surface antigen
MKHLVFSGLLLAALAHVAHADDIDIRTVDYLDVVETSDGSVWKGVVIEQVPGQTYKLVTSDGSVHVIKAADVVKLTKQKNPWRVAATPSASAEPTPASRGENGLEAHASPGAGSLPAPFAVSGMRASANVAILFGTGDLKNAPTSFGPDIRVGYEQLYGNFGLEGGGLLRWTDWRMGVETDDMMWTLETQAYGRAALHVSRAAPYVGVALGTDTNYVYASQVDMSKTTVGFGMNLQFGLPIAVTPGIALELGGDYHPGTDTIVDGSPASISYFALRAGAAGRF